jgi:DNA invertase Pin-like site-specific DNA recombinase
MPETTPPPAPLAFSYVRFSHPDQSTGDSLRRQTEATRQWCERHGAILDTAITLHDLGKSAYTGTHRQNPDRNALAAFLKLVESGRVPRGSYLVLENLDRLSREHIQPALLLALNLLQAGIRIVQLKPAEMVFDDKSDTLPVMMMMMELSRGHGESAMKSERIGAAWRAKKAAARADGSVQTSRCPGWLRVVGRQRVGKHASGGTFELVPERVMVVKRIFKLAIKTVGHAGHGLNKIVQQLTRDEVPTFGRSGRWERVYVRKILTNRAVLGEYQPKRHGKAEGDPVPNYYPAVIDEATFAAAQLALAGRLDQRGSPGKKVASLFTGLLHDARTGERMLIRHQTRGRHKDKGRHKAKVLIPARSLDGAARAISFPYRLFETAILSLLQEIDPAEVLGNGTAAEAAALAVQLDNARNAVAAIEASLDELGDSPALHRRLAAKEAEAADLARQLAAARQKEHNPPSAALAEAKTLMTAAESEDTRARLRQLLRASIDRIVMLVVPRGGQRLAAVQVLFKDDRNADKRRDYLILYKAAGNGRKGGWWACSLADVAGPEDLDLRDRDQAAALAKELAEADLAELAAKMAR